MGSKSKLNDITGKKAEKPNVDVPTSNKTSKKTSSSTIKATTLGSVNESKNAVLQFQTTAKSLPKESKTKVEPSQTSMIHNNEPIKDQKNIRPPIIAQGAIDDMKDIAIRHNKMGGVLYPMKSAQFIGNLDDMTFNLRPYKNIDIASDSKKTIMSSQSNANTGAPSVSNEKNIKMKIKDEIGLDNQPLANKSVVNQSSSLPHEQNIPCKTQSMPITSNQSNMIPKETVSENNKDSNKNEGEQTIQMLGNKTVETRVKFNATTENKEIESDVVQKEAAEIHSTNDKNKQETLIADTQKLETTTHLNTAPQTQEKPNTPAPNHEKSNIQQTQNSQTTETTDVGIGAKIKNFFSKFLKSP